MKKTLFLSIVLIFSISIYAQQQAKRFALKSGKLVMKLSGSTTGTKTIYFDDYGHKYYEHEESVTEVKMFGMTDREETNKILIMNKDRFWTIDNINGDHYKGTLNYYEMGQKMVADMNEAEQKKLADDVLKSMGGQKLGTEDVLGYSCEKITVMGAKSWIYKGIALRSEANVMGIVSNEIATSFDENISIPASKFQAPSDISFDDVDARKQAAFGQMEMLMEEEEDDEEYETITPITYPYEKFLAGIANFKPQGYAQTMITNQDGQYMVLYNMGFTNIVSVVASSDEDVDFDDPELNHMERFTHKGRDCAFGNLDEGGMPGNALFIRYPEHDMFIVLMSAPGKDKQTLLDWSEDLDF